MKVGSPWPVEIIFKWNLTQNITPFFFMLAAIFVDKLTGSLPIDLGKLRKWAKVNDMHDIGSRDTIGVSYWLNGRDSRSTSTCCKKCRQIWKVPRILRRICGIWKICRTSEIRIGSVEFSNCVKFTGPTTSRDSTAFADTDSVKLKSVMKKKNDAFYTM